MLNDTQLTINQNFMKKFYSTLIMFCALILSSAMLTAQEVEPNDVSIAANSIVNNTTFPGNLDVTSDVEDWYVANIPMNGSVVINAAPSVGLDLDLTVYSSIDGGATLQFVTSSTVALSGGVETITGSNIMPGTYYIQVKAISGLGGYSYNMTFQPQAGTTGFVVDNFEDGNFINNLQGGISVFDDNSVGGLSSITYGLGVGAAGSNNGLNVSYNLNIGTMGFNPYVGASTSLTSDASVLNISSSTGITINYVGPSIKLQIATQNVTDFSYYEVTIPYTGAWTKYSFNWNQFTQPGWGVQVPLDLTQASAIVFYMTAPSGSGFFNVDDIALNDYVPAQQAPGFVLDNFEDGDFINNLQQGWGKYDDIPAGGLSVVNYSFGSGYLSNSALQVDYTLDQGTLGYDPYVGVSCPFNSQNAVLDLSSSTGVSFYYKGDASKLLISTQDVTDYAYYEIQIPYSADWTMYTYNWNNFMQPGWTSDPKPLNLQLAQSFQFHKPGPTGLSGFYQIDDLKVLNFIPLAPSVQSITLTNNLLQIPLGGSATVGATCLPSGSNQAVVWSVLDPSIAQVDQSGKVTAISVGTTMVKATSVENASIIMDCQVEVFAGAPLIADFGLTNSVGYAPLNVNFYNYSTGNILNYQWDFNNDGTIDSNSPSPTYTYTIPGIYSVRLIVIDGQGNSNVKLISNIVTVNVDNRIKYCDVALSASLGSNYLNFDNAIMNEYNQKELWYSYTATSNTRLKVDLCNSGYQSWAQVNNVIKGCNYINYVQDVKITNCNDLSSSIFPITAGETIYFSIVSNGKVGTQNGFSFEVSEVPIGPGDACTMPLSVNLGVNSANTSTGDAWFSYLPTKDGYIEASTCGLTSLNTYVQIYKNCNYYYSGNDDNCGVQSKVLIPVLAGEVIQIVWRDNNGKGIFDWNLNFIDYSDMYLDFFASQRFGVDSAIVTFTSNSMNTMNVEWDFNNDGIFENQEQNPTVAFMFPGIYSVTMRGTGYDGTTTQTLTKQDYIVVMKGIDPNQTYCQIAKSANIGTNQMNIVDGANQYFKYTSDYEGKLIISTCNSSYPGTININNIFSDCNNTFLNNKTDYCNNGNASNVTIDVIPGTIVYFMINTNGYIEGFKDISFELQKVLPQPGDLCKLPILILNNSIYSISNSTPNQGAMYQSTWYEFTAPKDGVMELNTCINQDQGYLYFTVKNDCNNTSTSNVDTRYKQCSSSNYQGSTQTVQLKAGQKVLIEASGGIYQTAQWQFTFRDYYQGEICSNPIIAKEGINLLPAGQNEVFYKYTATDNGLVTLSNCQYVPTTYQNESGVMVKKSCDVNGEIIAYATQNCGNGAQGAFEVTAGQTYYISWYTAIEKWDLQFIKNATLPKGYTCENPTLITGNTMTVEPTGNISWFELSFPETGTVSLSTTIKTEAEVFLFDACVPISENMRSNIPFVMTDSAIVFWPQANKQYKLLIIFKEIPLIPYTLNTKYLSIDGQPQHVVCADPELINLGQHTTTTKFGNYWYTYHAKANTILNINFDQTALSDIGVYASVYNTCPSPFDGNGGNSGSYYYSQCGNTLPGITQMFSTDTVIYIQFRSRAESETINWSLNEYSTSSVALTQFSAQNEVSPAVINTVNKTIQLTVSQTSDINSAYINYTLAPGAQMLDMPNNYNFCSGNQLYFNNGQHTLKIVSANGLVNEIWTVSIQKATYLNNKTDIVTLNSEFIKNAVINTTTKKVDVTLAWYSPNCLNVYAQLSPGASSLVNLNSICFDPGNPTITTLITAEDGTTKSTWQINLVEESVPQSLSCSDPITVQEGYNRVVFDNTQTSSWMEYTVKNNGVLEIDGCNNWEKALAVYQDCSTPLDATYTNCNGGTSPMNAQINVTQGQVIRFSFSRTSTYKEEAQITIKEIPSLISYLLVTPQEQTVILDDTANFNLYIFPSQELVSNLDVTTSGVTLQQHTKSSFIAKQVGDATITYTSNDGTNITKSVIVHVKPKPILVTSLAIPSSINTVVGQSSKIPLIMLPTTADNKGVIWNSSDSLVAFVDKLGNLIANGVGTVQIHASSIDGSNKNSNICTVTVEGVDATSIIVNKSTLTIKVGEVYADLIATVLPINATDKSVVWSSANPSVVSVINNQLYGFSVGITTVKIALAQTPTIFATVTVNVSNAAEVVDKSILKNKIDIIENVIATITSQGLIGLNEGQYPQIAVNAIQASLASAKVVNSNTSASQTTVNDKVVDLDNALIALEDARIGKILIAYLNIKRDEILFNKGEDKQIYVEILPTNASYTELNYYSSNNNIAKVSSTGLISALNIGDAYVYAQAKDGSNKIDSVHVIVTIPLLSIYIPQSLSILEGSSIKIEPVKYPTDAVIDGYTWSSDDEAVASVDAYGNVVGISQGMANISIIETKTGKTATTLVYVESQAVSVTGINIIRDSIVLVLGQSEVLYPYITPQNGTNQNYSWSTTSNLIYINTSGIVTGFNIGIAKVYVTTQDGGFEDSIKVIVVPSAPPVILPIEDIAIETGTTEIAIPIEEYISDDNTAIADLTVDVINNPNFDATLVNGIIIITPTNPSITLTDVIEIIVTDADGQQTSVEIPITISAVPNQAPQFVSPDIAIKISEGTTFAPIDISNFVNDDYTLEDNLLYEITVLSENLRTIIINGLLEVSRNDANWVGIDSVEITVTDASGASSSQYIKLEISQLPNQAPTISPISNQAYSLTLKRYPYIYLYNYVTDDYTPASAIDWTFVPNAKLQISIANGKATILAADKNWVGSTTVTFTAYDQDGLSADVDVLFTQTATGSSNWVALPKISFTASQTTVGSGVPVTFTSSMSGADSWIWEFEGVNLTLQQRTVPNPTVTYTKGGKYTVKLFAQNASGDDSVVKVDYITIIGIDQVNPIACKGAPVTLTATVPASSGYTYEWSTGETTESIVVTPTGNSTYSLIVSKGYFQYEDAVSLTVPNSLSLPADTSLCAGASLVLTIPNFASYNWNNQGWNNTNSITLTTVGTTDLSVRDSYGCESSDAISIIELYPVPVVSLGNDKEVCLNSSITLTPTVTDGTTPYTYDWSNDENTPTIDVNSDGVFSLIVIDDNGCTASDEVNVTLLSPFAEPLGVASFMKDGAGVVIAWERTLGNRTESYEVQRETSVAGVFETIGTLDFGDTGQSFILDQDANVLTKSYSYKLVTIDSTCHNKAESIVHTTVHVTNNVNLSNHANLNWNKYVGLPISTYKIMKGTSIANLVEVDAISGNAAPSWTDPQVFVPGTVYRIQMVLPTSVETRWATQKTESGPFTLALSNIAEAQTGISQVEANVQVYPTIATDVVNIELGNQIENVIVQLVSTKGEVVYSSGKITESKIQISVADIAKGTYTVKVIAGDTIMSSSIIVQ